MSVVLAFQHADSCVSENVREVKKQGKNDTNRQKRLLPAPLRHSQCVYLHDRNAEVGVDEGCGPTCLNRAELWKRHIPSEWCLVFMCSCYKKALSGTLFLKANIKSFFL